MRPDPAPVLARPLNHPLCLMSLLQRSLILLYACLPFQFAVAFPGGSIALVRPVFILLTVVWIGLALVRRVVFFWQGAAWYWASFLFWMFFSVLFAEEPGWALRKAVFLAGFAFLPWMLVALFQERPDFRGRLLRGTVWGGLAAAGVGLLQFGAQFVWSLERVRDVWHTAVQPFFLGGEIAETAAHYSSLLVNVGGTTLLRASAFFPDPHILAYYAGMLGLAAAVIGWHRPTERRFWWTAGAFLVLADSLTFSRGGYLGLLAGLAYAGLQEVALRGLSRRSLTALFIGSVLLAGVLSPWSPVGTRLWSAFHIGEGSNQGRLEMWEAGARAFASSPLVGVGLGNFPLFVMPSADYREPYTAHSLYLDVASEAGFIAVLSLGLFIAAGLWEGLRSRDGFARGAAAGIAVFAAHSVFESPLFSVHVLPLLLLLSALVFSAPRYADRK